REIKVTRGELSLVHRLGMNGGVVVRMEKIYREVWKEGLMEWKKRVMVDIRKVGEKMEKDGEEGE
uniref:winged helix-turn-helix domain-containing protein n=1 Tax=Geobacillus sp. (strain Y412MC10) TaxID=481743 RepID=UPI0037C6D085